MAAKDLLGRAACRFLLFSVFAFSLPEGVFAQDSTLPFTVSVTKMPLDSLPDYLTPRSPDEWMDFPVSTAMINGDFWVMFKNGETKPAFRYKGTNFENATRQKDGTIYTPVSRPYILGGMWYDSADKKLYAPLHCETRGYYTTILRQIHLASSTDLGLTWKYEGPLVTRDNPDLPLPSGREASGLYWDGGEGDFFLYVDTRGGYIYLYTNSYTWPKPGVKAPYFFRHHVARCRISDKMAPGKWQKFYNGSWSEPGLGGKASDVNGYYVMYNTYLKKYISFNYDNSLSVCTDLSKQDWTPCFKIKGDYWGGPKSFAWLVTGEDKSDVYTGGKTLYLYSYWEKAFAGLYKVELGPGETADHEGYVAGYAKESQVSAAPSKLYLYGSQYESSDSVESMHYRRVDCMDRQMIYSGSWVPETREDYYGRTSMNCADSGSSVEFTFKAGDIFWRAVKGPGCGKADVFLDHVFQATVDCWASPATPFQFAFIKRGLDPSTEHTIRIIVRGEKNEHATGTVIKNLVFEYTADNYLASDGFSSQMGKNNWYYQQKTGRLFASMVFNDPYWKGVGGSEIGYFHMQSGSGEATRKWIAPHAGMVRMEGVVERAADSTGDAETIIQKNGKKIWESGSLVQGKKVSYNFTRRVRKDDCLYFILKNNPGDRVRITWDPSITFEDK
jgi:hypothetical protein